jgi:hypothetical protein
MDGPVVSIDDYERIAKAKLPAEVYDYFAGGARLRSRDLME